MKDMLGNLKLSGNASGYQFREHSQEAMPQFMQYRQEEEQPATKQPLQPPQPPQPQKQHLEDHFNTNVQLMRQDIRSGGDLEIDPSRTSSSDTYDLEDFRDLQSSVFSEISPISHKPTADTTANTSYHESDAFRKEIELHFDPLQNDAIDEQPLPIDHEAFLNQSDHNNQLYEKNQMQADQQVQCRSQYLPNQQQGQQSLLLQQLYHLQHLQHSNSVFPSSSTLNQNQSLQEITHSNMNGLPCDHPASSHDPERYQALPYDRRMHSHSVLETHPMQLFQHHQSYYQQSTTTSSRVLPTKSSLTPPVKQTFEEFSTCSNPDKFLYSAGERHLPPTYASNVLSSIAQALALQSQFPNQHTGQLIHPLASLINYPSLLTRGCPTSVTPPGKMSKRCFRKEQRHQRMYLSSPEQFPFACFPLNLSHALSETTRSRLSQSSVSPHTMYSSNVLVC